MPLRGTRDNSRPRLTAKVLRGLILIADLAEEQLQKGKFSDEASVELRTEARRGLEWIHRFEGFHKKFAKPRGIRHVGAGSATSGEHPSRRHRRRSQQG